MKKISCVIPVFNEEGQVAAVLDVILEVQQKTSMEIIVVNDGSCDMTPAILNKYKDNIQIITHKQNKGKSCAVASGLKASKGEYILLVDADLIGLTAKNIFDLLSPVQRDVAEVTMSIRKNSYPHTRMIKLDFLTGERVFPRNLITNHIDEIKKLPSFALEVFLNNLVIQHGYSIRNIYWKNVSNHYKYRKRGLYTGLKADSLLIYDIAKVMPAKGWLQQNIALKRLSIEASPELEDGYSLS